jgi:pSer/pThr/pTyr-binding forkhead associated (FHA) protein
VPPVAAGAADTRRLVAVLAAPGLGPGGTVFAVRAGKNSIGGERGSDIALANDPEVSREHALLLHRKGAFHLADRMSTNGTWVNGQEVSANGTVPLHDRDRIRCGKTDLVFLVIDAGETSEPGGEVAETQA